MTPGECRQDLQYRILLRYFLLQEEAADMRAAAAKLVKENHDLRYEVACLRAKGKGGLVTGARVLEELMEIDRLKAEGKGVPSGPHAR